MCFFLISIACPIDTSTFVSPRVYFVHFTSHSNYIANCVLRLINIFVHQRVCRFVVLRLFERPRRNIFFYMLLKLKDSANKKIGYLKWVFDDSIPSDWQAVSGIHIAHSSSTFFNLYIPSAFTFHSASIFCVGIHIGSVYKSHSFCNIKTKKVR